MLTHKGYTGVFEYDPELNILAGHVVDLRDQIYFEGTSLDELRQSMQTVVDHYLEVCEEMGDDPDKSFSGRLNARLGTELHQKATVAAAAAGVSLNTWLVRAVEESLASP